MKNKKIQLIILQTFDPPQQEKLRENKKLIQKPNFK
jgi:hypothetical protein